MNGKKNNLTQSQKMMVFVLSMSLYGLSNLFTELIPSFHVGIVEFSVEYFAFIPLTLCMLFNPLYAAIGAATGEIIFGEIMLGQFGGFGEIEKFVLFSLGMYIAGIIVKDPKNKVQVGVASLTGVIIHQFFSTFVDILKVQLAVESFEVVPGLPESVFFTEGFAFLNDILFSGILFCLIPTLYLVPRLYGKIEPLLGIKPRDTSTKFDFSDIFNTKGVISGIFLIAIAATFEIMSESGINIIDWEASWAESSTAMIISITAAAIIFISVIRYIKTISKRKKDISINGQG